MINFKQEELIEYFMNRLREKFPEVELLQITEAFDDSETLWLWVPPPEGDEAFNEFIDFSADILTDIFMEYGYHILVMPAMPMKVSDQA
jgi:hypothetical protein